MNRAEDKTILVVDDETDIRTFLSMVIEDAGFKVIEACDGEEALQIIKKQIPDLISLDLVMPRKSGIRFLHELRRNKKWKHIPVVIVSGHISDEEGSSDFQKILQTGLISGRSCCLDKPVNPTKFVNMLKNELGIKTIEKSSIENTSLKHEITELLEQADEETLKAFKELLKKQH